MFHMAVAGESAVWEVLVDTVNRKTPKNKCWNVHDVGNFEASAMSIGFDYCC